MKAMAWNVSCETAVCAPDYVDALNVALREYNVCDRVSAAAFLGQVIHETGFMVTGTNIDGGVGSLLMIQANFKPAVNGMIANNPSLNNTLMTRLANALAPIGMTWADYNPVYTGNNTATTADSKVGAVLAGPDYFWRTGLWFLQASSLTNGPIGVPGCSGVNLLTTSGAYYTRNGANRFGSFPTQSTAAPANACLDPYTWYTSYDDVGFRRVSRCVYGLCTYNGSPNREGRFDAAYDALTT